VIGRPFVRRATLNLPNGKTFTIVAEQLDDAHAYVGAVSLNGKPLTRTWLDHAEILAGGELRFVLQAEPNRTWGTGRDARPYSMNSDSTSVAAP
jgi:putative alpha-1,2-mannosidase